MPYMTRRDRLGIRGTRTLGRVVALAALIGAAGCSATEPAPPGGGGGSGGGKGGAGGRGGTAGSPANGGSSGAGGDTIDAASGDDANADGNAAPIQMKIAWWGSTDRHERTIKVLQLFEQKHPQIHFSYEYDASTPYWAKMNAHAADNTLPDIMQQDYAYIGEWTAKDRLLALDDLAAAGGPLDLSDIPKKLLDGGRIGGKLMGLSLGSNTQCWVLDVDAFAAAGVSLPSDTWTWEDFERIAGQIKTKSNKWGYGVSLYLYTPWKALFLSAGEWVFSPDNRAVGWSDGTPWIEHWKRELRLQDAGAIPSYDEEKTQFPDSADVAKTPIVVGKSAMEQIHSNQLLALWNAAGMTHTYKLVAAPRLTGKGSSVYIKPSQYLSILKGTKYPREAAMLLDFVSNDLEANDILQAERGVPVAGKVLAALKPKLGKAQAEAFDLLDRVSKDARPLPLPDPPEWSSILNTIYLPKVTIPILHKQLSPEEGVALYVREANALLPGSVSDGGVDGGVGDGGSDAGDGGEADGPEAGTGDGPSTAHALLVVGATPLVGNDVPLQARLAQKLTVDVLPEAMATSDSATGKAVVIISSSSSLAMVNTKFRDVNVPVILMEPNLMPSMQMTADVATDHGTVAGQTKISLVKPAGPLAAGLSGDVTVYTVPWRVVFGAPSPAAMKVATVVGVADQMAIFAYPKDAMMVGKTAPAKRVGFFAHDSVTANLAEDGLKLLDAAVDWAIAP